MIDNDWWRLILLSLRSNFQIHKYLYKIMIVCVQAVFITWLKLVSSGLLSVIADIRLILEDN